MDQSVAQDSSFDQPKHSMAFVNRCCDHTPTNVPASQQSRPSHQTQAQQQRDSEVPSNTSKMPQRSEGQTGFVQAHTSDPQTSGRSHQSPSKEDEDAASPSVHFFMMGAEGHRGWKACHSWPPPGAASPPLKLFLNKAPGPALKATRSSSWLKGNRKSAQVAGNEDAAPQVPYSSTISRLTL